MTKYFIDANGKYIGGFDGAKPPKNSIEVSKPPGHALDKWNGKEWTRYNPPNIKGFFNELALTILAGDLPGDVHPKAKLVQDIISPIDQAAALVALASDPAYTKEQVITLNQLMAKHGLELPAVERE